MSDLYLTREAAEALRKVEEGLIASANNTMHTQGERMGLRMARIALANVLDSLPVVDAVPAEEELERTPVGEWRLAAYYYAFEPTGLAIVDKILSAVAVAGKMWHGTSEWGSPGYSDDDTRVDKYYPHLRGQTCQEAIQNAAEDCAAAVRHALRAAKAMADERERIAALIPLGEDAGDLPSRVERALRAAQAKDEAWRCPVCARLMIPADPPEDKDGCCLSCGHPLTGDEAGATVRRPPPDVIRRGHEAADALEGLGAQRADWIERKRELVERVRAAMHQLPKEG